MRVACLWFPETREVEPVAENCLRFTPQICIREGQAVFLEIGKCYRLYSEEIFFARAVRLLEKMQISARVGVAGSIEWALVAAKYGTILPEHLPLDALYDIADPLARDEKCIPFVKKLIAALPDLGVSNLHGFQHIPRKELASRFGAVGLLCRQRLDGELVFPWKAWMPPEVIEEQITYMYAECPGAQEPLLFEAKKLLDRLFVRLRARGLKAAGLQIEIRCENVSINPQRERDLSLEFLLPQGEAKGALGILREFFSKEFDRRPLLSNVEKFVIRVSRTVPFDTTQKNLYHGREERMEALGNLLSQLSQAHGKGSIFQALTVEERLPEHSWQKVARLDGSGANLRGRVPLRPTNLVKPQRIEVTERHIYIKKKPFVVKKWSETAERISARWLDGLVDRTYYQVEVEDGPLLWIYCEEGNHFYLHGFYG
ncbi:MAG: hypothetical protein EOP11_11120 [Proteobacteria bacterium]|nr:MAG: hypothetical protein EOP11_11120 [Pseudomonadota bacterium]